MYVVTWVLIHLRPECLDVSKFKCSFIPHSNISMCCRFQLSSGPPAYP